MQTGHIGTDVRKSVDNTKSFFNKLKIFIKVFKIHLEKKIPNDKYSDYIFLKMYCSTASRRLQILEQIKLLKNMYQLIE